MTTFSTAPALNSTRILKVPRPNADNVCMPLDDVTETSGGARTLTAGRTGVATYDFRRPTKLSREGVRLLQVTFETFARRLTTLLTSGLRQVCRVTPKDISQQTYDEFVNSRPLPTLIIPIGLPQLQSTAVMEFSLPVALSAIDHMLGGPGGEQPERTLTDIETMLIHGLLDQIVGVLAYALEPVAALEPTVGALEYNAQFVQVVAGNDATLVGVFDLAIGAQESELSLCIPLAPILPKLNAQRVSADKTAATHGGGAGEGRIIANRLIGTDVDVTVEFAPVHITPTQALELAVGDVIPLNHRVGRPLLVKVGDMAYASAIAGRSGNQLAALITETL
ncbi:MAG: FliM/FliN family flagellar motor switch protein [Nakamurella sp.]